MNNSRPYLIVNIILAGMIGLIFIYSGLFSARKDNHPVPSFFEEITGQPSPSSGMSRAFSEIIRGDLESALKYNPDSLLIFAFFLIQLAQRAAISLLLLRPVRLPELLQDKHLLIADAFLTVSLFVYCFWGQIQAMVSLITG